MGYRDLADRLVALGGPRNRVPGRSITLWKPVVAGFEPQWPDLGVYGFTARMISSAKNHRGRTLSIRGTRILRSTNF